MIRTAISFFILALVSYAVSFNNIAGMSEEVGKAFLAVFLGLAVISFLGSLETGRETKFLP